MPHMTKKILGENFGALTPYRRADSPTTDKGRQPFWLCRCKCGEVAKVRQDRLLSGKTKSCGCAKTARADHLREMAFERKLAAAMDSPTRRVSAPPPVAPRTGVTAKQVNSYKKVYGLTPEEWANLVAAQSGRCAICGTSMSVRPLVVDHNHATGKVRGLLCRKCNSGLGMFDDEIATLAKAVKYLTLY